MIDKLHLCARNLRYTRWFTLEASREGLQEPNTNSVVSTYAWRTGKKIICILCASTEETRVRTLLQLCPAYIHIHHWQKLLVARLSQQQIPGIHALDFASHFFFELLLSLPQNNRMPVLRVSRGGGGEKRCLLFYTLLIVGISLSLSLCILNRKRLDRAGSPFLIQAQVSTFQRFNSPRRIMYYAWLPWPLLRVCDRYIQAAQNNPIFPIITTSKFQGDTAKARGKRKCK